MISWTKNLSQALMIVSNNPLVIISCRFILCDMLYSCPFNHSTIFCQDAVAQCAAYYLRHTKPSSDTWVLFWLFLFPLLAKFIVTKISPFTDINSVTIYVFNTCDTAFVWSARVNLSFPYQSEAPTFIGYSLENRPPFPPPFEYFNQILSAILPGWERFWISPCDNKIPWLHIGSCYFFHLLSRCTKVQIVLGCLLVSWMLLMRCQLQPYWTKAWSKQTIHRLWRSRHNCFQTLTWP